jgi:hypothetical protein
MTSTQQKPDTFKSLSLPDYTERYPGNGSGLWPTPTAPVRWNTPNTMDALSAKSQQALDHEHETARPGRSNPNNLRDQVAVSEGQTMWPTPTESDYKGPNFSGGDFLSANGLATRVAKWPTPTASEIHMTSPYGQIGLSNHPDIIGPPTRPKMASKSTKGDGINVARPDGAHNPALNPNWVEWLMGLPKGWTSLEPMDPDAFEEWATDMASGTWWDTERDIPRVTTERTNRAKRLKALGNGIVPASCALFAGTVKNG